MIRRAPIYRYFTPAGWTVIASLAVAAVLAGASLPV